MGNIKIESDGQTERKTEIERTACTRLVQSQWVKVNRVGGGKFHQRVFPCFLKPSAFDFSQTKETFENALQGCTGREEAKFFVPS